MSRNMVWDALFHLGTWMITLVGIFMLRSERRSHPRDTMSAFGAA